MRIFGILSREFSYKYIPANALVILAVIALIFGIGIFGNGELGKILADLILIVVVAGIFVLLALLLAYSTGATYQDQTGKNKFFLIGSWHAFLQILTPFILFYYAHWSVVLGILVLVNLLNGFDWTADLISNRLPEDDSKNDKAGWQQTVRKIVNFRFAAWLMKQNKRRLLAASWVIYGLIVLLAPFVLFPDSKSLHDTIKDYFPRSNNSGISYWSYIAVSLLILAGIGYRMSRVWFSWYLGVSVLYNGHNNEAGGLARIEDFKHILRIKVEKDKLTVFVIGLDTARPNLDDKLKLKLVDKFELKCSEAS